MFALFNINRAFPPSLTHIKIARLDERTKTCSLLWILIGEIRRPERKALLNRNCYRALLKVLQFRTTNPYASICNWKQWSTRFARTLTRSCMMTWSMFGRWCTTAPCISRLQWVTYTICPERSLELVTFWKPGPTISVSRNSFTRRVSSNLTEYRFWPSLSSQVFMAWMIPG